MVDTRKTQMLTPLPQLEEDAAILLRKIYKEIQQQVCGEMTMPEDPTHRLITINTINNVFDRFDDAIERFVKERKEKNHE